MSRDDLRFQSQVEAYDQDRRTRRMAAKTASKQVSRKQANRTSTAGSDERAKGVDSKLFRATMKQRAEDMAAARSSAQGGFTPFPETGTYFAELIRVAEGVKNSEYWARPIFRVVSGPNGSDEHENQEFAGDGGNTGKRMVGLWILAQGLTGGQAPDEAEDLQECYQGCVGNLYQLNVVDSEEGYRNVRIQQQVDSVPDGTEEEDD